MRPIEICFGVRAPGALKTIRHVAEDVVRASVPCGGITNWCLTAQNPVCATYLASGLAGGCTSVRPPWSCTMLRVGNWQCHLIGSHKASQGNAQVPTGAFTEGSLTQSGGLSVEA